MEVGDLEPQELNAGDVVLIPAMCRQRITNIGQEDLIFLAICTPRFSAAVYEDLEDGSDFMDDSGVLLCALDSR